MSVLLGVLLSAGCGTVEAPPVAASSGAGGEAVALVAASEAAVAACAGQPTVDGCREGAALFEALAPAHLGHGRTSDMVLFALARLADDHAQLVRALGEDGANVAVAEQHLVKAVAAAQLALRAGAAEPADPYGTRVPTADDDAAAVEHLHDQMQRYALDQGTDPARVRWRQIHARLSGMEAEAAARPDEARTQALRALLSVYRDALERYRAGAVTTDEARAEVTQAIATARAAWRDGR
ncbi:MAG: hypothetical protein H6732_01455 [Alphaproteobacteria bacterium]|nr:hypothetical protein [Alphaproteobacteria bacterium]